MHRRTILIPRFTFLFNQPEGAAAGGSAPAATPPTTSTPPATPPATPAPGAASSAPATPGAPGASAAPPGGSAAAAQARGFTYDEDRGKWIPPYRFEQVSTQLDEERRLRALAEGRIRALMGVAEPEDPRRGQIRQQFLEMFPEFAPLLNGELMEGLQSARASDRASWQRHAHGQVTAGVALLAKELGVDPKTLGQKGYDRFSLELKRYIVEDETGRRNWRYEHGDPTLLDEVVADIAGFYIAPVRQTSAIVNAGNAERVSRLPSSGPAGSLPATTPAPKPEGKARHEFARQRLNAALGNANP